MEALGKETLLQCQFNCDVNIVAIEFCLIFYKGSFFCCVIALHSELSIHMFGLQMSCGRFLSQKARMTCWQTCSLLMCERMKVEQPCVD
jgi:hypothetical protein